MARDLTTKMEVGTVEEGNTGTYFWEAGIANHGRRSTCSTLGEKLLKQYMQGLGPVPTLPLVSFYGL